MLNKFTDFLTNGENMSNEVQDVQDVSDQPAEKAVVTIADLQVLARIVDLASGRGAFRAPELSQVGTVYDKLVKFLSQVEAEQKPQTEE